MDKGSRSDTLLTILQEGTVMEGTLNVPHAVRIDGTFKGKVETNSTFTVGPTGVIEADIRARNAQVGGKIIGNLIADERVELEATASLTGDLRCRTLVVCEGATFQGKSAMGGDESLTTV